MNVFNLRNQLIGDYSEYVRSYIQIQDARIKDHVQQRLDEGMLWQEAVARFTSVLDLQPDFQAV
jgi:hypothetical protein